MNKSIKIILAIFGGVERTFFMFSPMLLGTIWINISELDSMGSYLVFGIGLIASLFRAIKVGFCLGKSK